MGSIESATVSYSIQKLCEKSLTLKKLGGGGAWPNIQITNMNIP